MTRHACRRIGPGRLPYASRRDVGGGIAMAATGLAAASIWFGVALLGNALVTGQTTIGFLLGMGVVVPLLAIPAAFVVGAVCWRYAYSEGAPELSGAVLGGVTATVSLLVGALAPAVVFVGAGLVTGEVALAEAASLAVVVGFSGVMFGFGAAGWLVVPIGAFGGWYHERAKRWQ